ncbi:MAG: hypothetical protein ACFFAQ_11955 [Promethearchaeota archaeon]
MIMGKGKVVAIIGAAVGVLSVILSLVLPALFSWYHLEVTGGGLSDYLYLTAFGTIDADITPLSAPDEIVILVLIGGILVLAGAALCIVSALTEQKILGIIGGIAMLLGPTFLIFDLLGQMSEFAEFMDNVTTTLYDENIFFATFTPGPGINGVAGLWIGFFMAYGGGILGLIGGATVE